MSHPRNADDIFAEFSGSPRSPSAPKNGDDTYAEFFRVYSLGGGGGDGGADSSTGDGGGDVFAEIFKNSSPFAGGGSMHYGGAKKAASIEYKLPCSLEHLYKGTTKKMRISREIIHNGKRMQVEEILTVDVKPGWKKGTKITFPEKGNEQPGVIPADVVFIIDEKPHPVFTREDNDLVVTQKISVLEAFTGYTVNLTTPAGRRLTIPINSVIHPEYVEMVPEEGMPLQKDQTKKGNLRIKFNIQFPTRLTSEQKTGLAKLLG